MKSGKWQVETKSFFFFLLSLGPRPREDRVSLVFRSAESSVALDALERYHLPTVYSFRPFHFVGQPFDLVDPPVAPLSSSGVSTQPDPPVSSKKLSAVAPVFVPKGAPTHTWSFAEFPSTEWIEPDAVQQLTDFAAFWQGSVASETVGLSNGLVTTFLTLVVNLPSLKSKSMGEPVQNTTLSLNYTDHDGDRSRWGAHHAMLQSIRQECHGFWLMFVLRLTAWSESYIAFLRQFHLARDPPAHRVCDWFRAKQLASGPYECSVPWGDGMQLWESAQHVDPAVAREQACQQALDRSQSQYPLLFVTRRPSGKSSEMIEAIQSFIRIHSSYNEEYLQERKCGVYHQYMVRSIVLAEATTAWTAADKILTSMSTVSDSGIQARLNLSPALVGFLRTPTPTVDDITNNEPPTYSGPFVPTRVLMTQLNREHQTQMNNQKEKEKEEEKEEDEEEEKEEETEKKETRDSLKHSPALTNSTVPIAGTHGAIDPPSVPTPAPKVEVSRPFLVDTTPIVPSSLPLAGTAMVEVSGSASRPSLGDTAPLPLVGTAIQ